VSPVPRNRHTSESETVFLLIVGALPVLFFATRNISKLTKLQIDQVYICDDDL
jgi:hypothetical protein